jgi:hypothetical protein
VGNKHQSIEILLIAFLSASLPKSSDALNTALFLADLGSIMLRDGCVICQF